MTTLLTLTGMFGQVSRSTPQISYVTKLDAWMVTSMIFVFTSLLELVAALLYKMHLTGQNKKSNKVASSTATSWVVEKSTTVNSKRPKTEASHTDDIEKKILLAERRFTLFYFTVFLAFCITYWLSILAVDV